MFYLAYGLNQATFIHVSVVGALVGFLVVLSIFVYWTTASLMM